MELYREEKRKDIEMTRRRRGGVKRRETSLYSNQLPKCSPHPEHPKRVTELSREEKGEGRDRGKRRGRGGEKGESKGEKAVKPVITISG